MATAGDLHLLGIGYRMVRGGEEEFARASTRVRRSGKEAADSVNAVDGALDHLRTRFSGIISPAAAVDAALAAIVATTVALVAITGTAVRTSVQFEAALVGVGKTANIEGAALRSMGEGLDDLSRRIPVAAQELLTIAEAAGSLGVEGAANVLKFTETVAKLGRSSDLAGDEGATALARILNVTGESVSTVDSLASVIVSLGNAFAATESEIAHHTGEVAKATAVYNIGSAASAAMAATLASFGVRAELSGSAVGRSFRMIEDAVKSGGDKLQALAKISGASAEELKAAWEKGPVDAFNLFLQGVRNVANSGGNVAQALASVKLEGEEILKVIPVLAQQFNTLAKAQGIAAKEAGDPTALNTEFARAAQTLKTELDLLRNTITSVYRIIGDQLAPVVRDIVVGVRTWMEANRGAAQSLGKDLADALRFVADSVVFLIRHFDEIQALAVALITVQLTPWLHGVGTAVLGQVAAWRTWIAVKLNAVQSEAQYALEAANSARGVASYTVTAGRATQATGAQAVATRAAATAHGVAAVAVAEEAAATGSLVVAQRGLAGSTGLVVRGHQALLGAAGGAVQTMGLLGGATVGLMAEQRALMVVLGTLFQAWRAYVTGALGPAGLTTNALTGVTRQLTGALAGQAAVLGAMAGEMRLLTAGNVAAAVSEQAVAAGAAATIPALGGQTLALTGATVATTGLTVAQRALLVITAALEAAWKSFTAWLVANPITAIALALAALAAAVFLVWKRTKEAREESERYHEELRTGRYLIDGYAAAHDDAAKVIEKETQRLKELRSEQGNLEGQIKALEPVAERLNRALEANDRTAYKQAVADARALGAVIDEASRKSGYEQITAQLEQMRLAMKANEEQSKLSADEIAVSEQKIRDNIEDSLEAERRRMLRARANVADLSAKAQEAETQLDRMMSSMGRGREGAEFALLRMIGRVNELKKAAQDAQVGLAGIGTRLEDLRKFAQDKAATLLNEGSYDQAAALLRKTGESEEKIQQRIELAKIFAGVTENLTRKQEENNQVTDFGTKKTDDAAKRFAQMKKEAVAAVAGLVMLTGAWAEGDEAVAKANRQLQINTQVASRSADELSKYEAQIREFVTAQVDGERKLQQAQTKAGLNQRIKDLDAQNKAYRENSKSIAEVILRQQQEARVREATAGAIGKERAALAALAEEENRSGAENAYLAVEDALKREGEEIRRLTAARKEGGAAAVVAMQREIELEKEVERLASTLLPQYRAAIEALIRTRRDQILADEDQAAADREHAFGLGATTKEMETLSRIRKSDFTTTRAWEEAIRAATVELRVQQAVMQATAEGAGPLRIQQIEEEIRAQGRLAEAQIRAQRTEQTLTDKVIGFGAALKEVLSGSEDGLGRVVAGLGQVIEGLGKAAEAGWGFKEAADAWAGIAQGLYAIADAAGILDQNVSQGGFGGRGEGNYGAEGSQVGAIIGAIIGAYYGSAEAGAAIGSAAGGILGSFIKKGAEESMAYLEVELGELATRVSKSEGGLGRFVAEIGYRINEVLTGILDNLGAAIDQIPKVSIKVRDGVISVWVGMVNARVQEMDQAITFAVTEILKQGDISGLSETIRTVLKNTTAMDLDQLARDLEFGQWYERLGMGEAAVAVEAALAEFRARFRKAVELGLDTGPIVQAFGQQLQGLRDQLLGIQLSPEDKLRQDVKAFNDQVSIIRAEQEARRADLLVKKAGLEADIAIVKAEGALGAARVSMKRSYLDAEARLIEAELTVLDLLMQAMAAIDTALAGVDGILASLPALISDAELQQALARLGKAGRGGQSRGDDRKDFLDELADLARTNLPDAVKSVLDLGDKLRDLDKRAKDLKISEEELRAARQALIDQQKQQILDPLKPYLDRREGGTYGMSDWQQQRADLEKTFADARAANAALLKETGQRAIAFWKINQAELRALNALAESAIASLGLPIEQSRTRMKALADTVGFMRDMVARGALSVDRFNDVMAQLGQQATAELFTMAAALLEQMGRFDEADRARRAADELNFHIQLAQINILFEHYVALGIITGDLETRLRGLLALVNDPALWPDFTLPAPQRGAGGGPPGGGGSEGGGASEVASDDARRRQEILDQIKAWNQLGESDVTAGLRDLHDTLVSMQADAQRLGISLTDLMAAHANAVEEFWDRTLEPYESGESDSLLDRLAEINRAFDEMAAAAQLYGGDQARIEAARAAEIERFWDEALEPIRELQERFQLGELGGLSPEQRLQEAQARFNDLAARAMAGDADAIQALPEAVEALLEQQRAFSGSGPAYQALVATIQGVLDQILSLGGGAGADVAAGAAPAAFAAGVPLPSPFAAGGLRIVRPEDPRPVALPVGTAGSAPGPLPEPDDRVDRLVDVLEEDVQARREDRRGVADLRAEVDRLVAANREQADRIDDLLVVVGRLTSLVESQERRAAQRG